MYYTFKGTEFRQPRFTSVWTQQEQHRLPAFHVLLCELHDIFARTLPACSTLLRAFDSQWDSHYVGFKHQQVGAAEN